MEQPLLQYYSDGTWGYNIWDQREKLQAGLGVLEQQFCGEHRERFFGRIGKRPEESMYGSSCREDEELNHSLLMRLRIAEKGYGLDRLINDKDGRVRENVAKQG